MGHKNERISPFLLTRRSTVRPPSATLVGASLDAGGQSNASVIAGLDCSFSPTGRTQETVIWQIKFRRCRTVDDGTELLEAPLRQIACASLQAALYQLYGYCPPQPALKQRCFWGV